MNCFCQNIETLTEVRHFGNNPGNLKMFIHNNFPRKTSPLPLVIVLHGCSQSAKDVADLTGWNKLADINQFIVLYPQQKFSNNTGLCFNWFRHQDIEKNLGECESIYQMIAYVRKHNCIDSNRIFISGLSAGGAMSVVMMATHPELFQGGAIFAGGAYKRIINTPKGLFGKKDISDEKLVKDVREQNPSYKGQYPALIVYQGLSDPIVKYNSMKALMYQWTGIHHADTLADKTTSSYLGIEDISRTEYVDSIGKVAVILYEVKNLGHKIMIKPGEKEDEGGQTGTYGSNKGYHSTYQTAKEFGILKK